jgi:hypothetical protein
MATKKNVAPQWSKIKAEFLQGATPRDLAQAYGLKASQISNKACEEGWVSKRNRISEKIVENVEEKITSLTNLALETLREVINDPETKAVDKVSASRAILDISGLKSLKQEISGVGATSVIINRQAVHVESDN